MIECLLIGDYDDFGNKLLRVTKFTLKPGNEFEFEMEDKKLERKMKTLLCHLTRKRVLSYSNQSFRKNIFKNSVN